MTYNYHRHTRHDHDHWSTIVSVCLLIWITCIPTLIPLTPSLSSQSNQFIVIVNAKMDTSASLDTQHSDTLNNHKHVIPSSWPILLPSSSSSSSSSFVSLDIDSDENKNYREGNIIVGHEDVMPDYVIHALTDDPLSHYLELPDASLNTLSSSISTEMHSYRLTKLLSKSKCVSLDYLTQPFSSSVTSLVNRLETNPYSELSNHHLDLEKWLPHIDQCFSTIDTSTLEICEALIFKGNTSFTSSLSLLGDVTVPISTIPILKDRFDSYSACDFELGDRLAHGGFGETWLANRLSDDREFVLKHFFDERGDEARLSERREAFFGHFLAGLKHVSRFVASLRVADTTWLIFEHEGVSLSRYIMDVTETGRSVPNQQWNYLRHHAHDFRSLVHQCLEALHSIHQRGVIHRDVTPSNFLLKLNPAHVAHENMSHSSSYFSREHMTSHHVIEPLAHLRLADFGSSLQIDPDLVHESFLYANQAPSMRECTLSYAPPELLFAQDDKLTPTSLRLIFATPAYDLWSLGLSILSIWMGGLDNVFVLDSRTTARIHAVLREREHMDEMSIAKALRLKSLMAYCIYRADSNTPTTSSCNQHEALQRWRDTDPLGEGFDGNEQLLDLILGLMHWNPSERISAQEAMQFPYFTHPHG